MRLSFCCKIRDWPVMMNPFPASRRLWMLGLNENLRAGMMVKGEVLECEKVTDGLRPACKYSRPADELHLEAMTVTSVETASCTRKCVDPGCKLEESDWESIQPRRCPCNPCNLSITYEKKIRNCAQASRSMTSAMQMKGFPGSQEAQAVRLLNLLTDAVDKLPGDGNLGPSILPSSQ